ncbi:MAG: hypothetical protein LBV80_09785 [Deltaproteobacteria bacterium]|jgi:hypothetical protein|nr:hypothetical protein [Deltaproteobacteria bacterium]
MFKDRANDDNGKPNLFTRLLWRGALLAQAALWGFLLFFVLHYWLVEVPGVRGYHQAGLSTGFDGLAGVVASLEPAWEEVNRIQGHSGGTRFSRLQGDTTFTVWKEQDEMPAWNAGLAKLYYNQEGRLLWVRRYLMRELYAEDKLTGQRFPLVFAWSARQSLSGGASALLPDGQARPDMQAGQPESGSGRLP